MNLCLCVFHIVSICVSRFVFGLVALHVFVFMRMCL